MKKTLLAGVAVAALVSAPALVLAQTSTSPGQSGTAPGQNRPPATSDAPGKSESAPGQNRPPATTSAPGRSESAPGQNRSDTTTSPGSKPNTTQPGRSETAPGQNRPPANTAAPGKSESAPGQNRPPANTAAPGRSESAPGQTRPDATAQPGSKPDSNQRSGTAGKPDSNTTTTGRTGDNNRAGDAARPGSTQAGSESSNASASVNLNTEQRTKVERAFREVKVEPERNVNFNISVGAVVDSGVRFRPLPPAIVQVVPQFRGYEYVAVRDQIVIVEPRSRRILYVMQHGTGRASINLTTEQRRMVKTKLATGPRMTRAIKVEDGMTVPPDVELRVIEQPIITEVPEIRPYRYFVVEDEVVLVDPGTRQVIEIIR
jgi:hypothetical protein